MSEASGVEKALPKILLGMTVVTGLLDAVSFLALGHVFTANMTGNIVLLAFACAAVPGVSVARSLVALGAFLLGACLGGRRMANPGGLPPVRHAITALKYEPIFLALAALWSFGYRLDISPRAWPLYGIISLTAFAMGIRNAVVRKLAVPDLTTTVLTLTITGIAADSGFARGNNPRLWRRVLSVLAMLIGASCGAVLVRHSIAATLVLAFAISLSCVLLMLRACREEAVA